MTVFYLSLSVMMTITKPIKSTRKLAKAIMTSSASATDKNVPPFQQILCLLS